MMTALLFIALWALLFAFPPVVKGRRSTHNAAGITGPSFRLQDNFVTLGNGSFAVPGPIDVTFTFATQLQFRPVASATGFRFDELFLVPA